MVPSCQSYEGPEVLLYMYVYMHDKLARIMRYSHAAAVESEPCSGAQHTKAVLLQLSAT
jgi:hypothetical protein